VPFRHPDRSHDLSTRIEYEVRERLEEAIDYVCLDALVRSRRSRGLPAPEAGNADDRRAYTEHVLIFLDRLRLAITPTEGGNEPRRSPDLSGGAEARQARLVAGQVALARSLPDYWQRFEAVSATYLSDAETESSGVERRGAVPGSGGEGRGLLARLFGRG
jgi:hypothetical protein